MKFPAILAFVTFSCIFCFKASAQIGFEHWTMNYKWNAAVATAIDQASNSYFIYEDNDTVGIRRHYIRKVKPNGESVWTKVLNSSYSQITKMYIDAQNHMYIGGYGNNLRGFRLTKLDTSGSVIFSRGYTYTQTGTYAFRYNGFTHSPLGILSPGHGGWSSSNFASVLKLDHNGNVDWMRFKPNSSSLICKEAIFDEDSNVVALIEKTGSGAVFILTKLSNSGDLMWSYRYNFLTNGIITVSNVTETSDGGYLVSGGYNLISFKYVGFIAKISKNGQFLWSKSFQSGTFKGKTSTNSHIILTERSYNNAISSLLSRRPSIVRLDLQGNYVDTYMIGMKPGTAINEIDAGPNGNISMAGFFYNGDTFGFQNVPGIEILMDSNIQGTCFSARNISYLQSHNATRTTLNWTLDSLVGGQAVQSITLTDTVVNVTESCHENDPWPCDESLIHLSFNNNNDVNSGLFKVDTSGNGYFDAQITNWKDIALYSQYNGRLGYNMVDSHLYLMTEYYHMPALTKLNVQGEIVFTSQVIGLPFVFQSNEYSGGDFDGQGKFYVIQSNPIYKQIYVVDVNSVPYQVIDSFNLLDTNGNPFTESILDLSFNVNDDHFYGFGEISNRVVKVNMDNQSIQVVGGNVSSGTIDNVESTFFRGEELFGHTAAQGQSAKYLIRCSIDSGHCQIVQQINYNTTDGCSCNEPKVTFKLISDSVCFGDTMTLRYMFINRLNSTIDSLEMNHTLPEGLLFFSQPDTLLNGTLSWSPILKDSMRISNFSLPVDTSIILITVIDTISTIQETLYLSTQATLSGLPWRDELSSDEIKTGIIGDSSVFALGNVSNRITMSDTNLCVGDTLSFQLDNYSEFDFWPVSNVIINNDSVLGLYSDSSYLFVLKYTNEACRVIDTMDVNVGQDWFKLNNDTLVCDADWFDIIPTHSTNSIHWSTGISADSIRIYSAGVYSGVGEDTNGCLSYDTIKVDLLYTPKIPDFNDTSICKNDTLILSFQDTNSIYSTGNQSSKSELQIIGAGSKMISASNQCGNDQRVIKIDFVPQPEFQSSPELFLCQGDSLHVQVDIDHGELSWVDTNLNENLPFLSAGNYPFVVSNACYSTVDTLHLYYFQSELDAGSDTVICEDRYTLEFPDSLEFFGFNGQAWNGVTIFTSQHITGWYFDECHNEVNDTFYVELFPYYKPYLPNTFTPDGDGLNDTWEPGYKDPKLIEYSIYDRWGRLVYSANGISGWDGKINGVSAPIGVYLISYTFKDCLDRLTIGNSKINILR